MAKAFPNTGVTIIDSSSDLTGFSPSEGLMVFQKDTNELKIYDGANWISVVDTDSPPGLTLINPTSVTNAVNTNGNISFSSQSSFSVNGCFSNLFTNYRLVCNISNASGHCGVLFRVDNVSTGNYNYASLGLDANASANNLVGASQTSALIGNVRSGLPYTNFILDIFNPFLSIQTSYAWQGHFDNSSSTSHVVRSGAGLMSTVASYSGFTFLTTANNISGNVRVYGYRDSI